MRLPWRDLRTWVDAVVLPVLGVWGATMAALAVVDAGDRLWHVRSKVRRWGILVQGMRWGGHGLLSYRSVELGVQ